MKDYVYEYSVKTVKLEDSIPIPVSPLSSVNILATKGRIWASIHGFGLVELTCKKSTIRIASKDLPESIPPSAIR